MDIENLMRGVDVEINLKQDHIHWDTNQQQIGQTPIAHTPNYYFRTPSLQFQSPVGGQSTLSNADPNNVFAHINNMWNVKVG